MPASFPECGAVQHRPGAEAINPIDPHVRKPQPRNLAGVRSIDDAPDLAALAKRVQAMEDERQGHDREHADLVKQVQELTAHVEQMEKARGD